MRLPRPIDAATQARDSTEGRRCLNPQSLQSPSVMSASLFLRMALAHDDAVHTRRKPALARSMMTVFMLLGRSSAVVSGGHLHVDNVERRMWGLPLL